MSAEDIFKTRRYLHFDEPIGPHASQELATNTNRVAAWGFMPMLQWILSVKKVKRSKDGKLETKSKDRPICYSTHKDAAIYAYYASLLNEAYEKVLTARKLSPYV